MTISTQTRTAGPFAGTGVVVSYPFAFKVFQASDLVAVLTSSGSVQSTLGLGTDYTVTLFPDQNASPGGSITLNVALPVGATLTLTSNVALTQSASLTNAGGFFPRTIEDALDRLTILLQQLGFNSSQTLRVPEVGGITALSSTASRANNLLGFDSNGNPVAVAPASGSAAALATDLTSSSNAAKGAGQVGFSNGLVYAAGTTGRWLTDLATSVGGALIGWVQSGTGAVLRTIQDRLRDSVSVFDFMTVAQIADVRAGTLLVDVTAAVQAAITAAGNGNLFFPDGAYKISALLTTAVNATPFLWGQGYGKCQIFQFSTTQGCFKFNSVNPGGGIKGMALANSIGGAVPGSSGVGLYLLACGNNFIVRDLLITNFDTGMRVEGSNGEYVKNVTIRYFSNFGIDIPAVANQLEGRYTAVQISNIGFSAPGASIGLSIKSSGGHFFKDFDILKCNQGVVIAPPVANQVSYCSFYNLLGDTSINDNWVVDGTNGTVVGLEMTGCWGGFSTNGSGLVTKGSGLLSMQWTGGRLRENGKHGWDHQGGVDVSVSNVHIAQNSKLATLTYNGVNVAANVSDWQLQNCKIGNFASSLGTSQLHCLNIAAGTSQNFHVTNNHFKAPGAGGLFVVNGSTAANWVIQGNLPIQTTGVSQNRSAVFSGSSIGTVAAGVTKYLAPSGQQATENDAFLVSARPGVVNQLIVQVDIAPGAGQNFTYTVRLNGANTVMTGSLTGAGAYQLVLQNAFSVSAADTLSIQVTTSAGAAAARHRFSLNIDG